MHLKWGSVQSSAGEYTDSRDREKTRQTDRYTDRETDRQTESNSQGCSSQRPLLQDLQVFSFLRLVVQSLASSSCFR